MLKEREVSGGEDGGVWEGGDGDREEMAVGDGEAVAEDNDFGVLVVDFVGILEVMN